MIEPMHMDVKQLNRDGGRTLRELTITSDKFNKDDIPHNGNKFLTGNGYFGVRGTLEEYDKDNMCAINLAGIYDRVGDSWRESVNAPNPLFTYVLIDGVKYSVLEAEPAEHTQTLDINRGIHKRKTIWKTQKGSITVECERFASMASQHFMGMKYTVSADFACDVEVVTGIDGDVWDINGPHFKEVKPENSDGIKSVTGITGEKGISVKTEEYIKIDFDAEREKKLYDKFALEHICFTAEPSRKYSIEKVAAVSTSADENKLNESAANIDYSALKGAHIKAWEKIWDMSYVEIGGDDEAELSLNYSIYHLNCIAPRNMKSMSIPARGLSGQVYKGAVFWDTEMFMIDYFIFSDPKIAKTLIQYRIDTLGGARTKAKEYGLNGAYYAWESQEGGYEACSNYNVTDIFTNRPMRTYFRDKQYHVSAAVVYAIMKYIEATGDYGILSDGAMEVVIECARMYRSLLIKKADSRFYEIRDVVGPDEYHERVNNNAYTNRMVKFVFETAVSLSDRLKELDENCYDSLNKKYDLNKLKEVFEDSAENMLIKEPNNDGIIEQFDGYFKLEHTSVDEVRSRLLNPKEYWGGAYGVAADTQVLKQADVVAMLSMFKNDYNNDIMKKNWEYYEPITEHGSSLSACMYSLLACYIGKTDYAYPLFIKSAAADLNKGGKEWLGTLYIGGTHPASEGGAWIVAIKGFAGIEITDSGLKCTPRLPKGWTKMAFKLEYKDKVYKVEIKDGKGSITEVGK